MPQHPTCKGIFITPAPNPLMRMKSTEIPPPEPQAAAVRLSILPSFATHMAWSIAPRRR